MTPIRAAEPVGEEGMHVRNIQEVRLRDPSLNGYGQQEASVGGLLPFAAVKFELMHFLPWEFSLERTFFFHELFFPCF